MPGILNMPYHEVMITFQTHLMEYEHKYISSALIESWFHEYAECFDAVKTAVTNGMLIPVKSSGGNGRVPPLAARYRVMPPRGSASDGLRHALLTLPQPLTNEYYSSHPKQYTEDRNLIDPIAAYVRRRGRVSPAVIPANERSFEIFGDEKLLLREGLTILRRLGVSLQILDCFRTSEPFVFFSYTQAPHTILISENRDSFSSLNRVLRTGRRVLGADPIDALIFGEGRKILRSLSFSLEMLNPNPDMLRFMYWGDLDPEGIAIFLELRNAYPDWHIEPASAFYEAMLDVADKAPPCTRSERRLEIDAFFSLLSPASAEIAASILKSGRYLPQEAVVYTMVHSILKP
ncbi:MAG TPA: DUF2220 family protein [Candidatus Ozemobacteraceae bacterium]|nr:DUF2220 family protein [Candidatus Ozemobacteraceae bacterium]